jgi:hypothetical protein
VISLLDPAKLHWNHPCGIQLIEREGDLVKLPVVDEDGFPITQRDVTQYPGLYFVGMNWLSRRNSVTLFGVNGDVETIIADMTQ